jgi:hypothetical protein
MLNKKPDGVRLIQVAAMSEDGIAWKELLTSTASK